MMIIDKIKVYLACVKMLKEVMELRGAESRAQIRSKVPENQFVQ